MTTANGWLWFGQPPPTLGGTTANGWLTHSQRLAVPPPTLGAYQTNNHHKTSPNNHTNSFRTPLRFVRRDEEDEE